MKYDKKELIRKYQLDKELSKAALDKTELVVFDKGELLFEEYKKVDCLYLFLSGKCKVSKLLENGIEGIITINKELQIYGEIELFSKTVANTTIITLEESYCLKIEYKEAMDIQNDISFLHFCIKQLSNKINQYDHHFLLNQHYPIQQKLCSYISLTSNNRIFNTNHTHLANYLGCSHRQLLRVIKKLVDIKLLRKQKNGYLIVDERQLQQLGINE